MYIRLLFGTAPAGDMLQIDEIFKELPNVFSVTDDILIVGYNADGKEHGRILRWVMQICHKETLKLK